MFSLQPPRHIPTLPKQKRISQIGIAVLPGTEDMRRLHRHVGFVPPTGPV
jgi:hypothetical protein